MTLLVKRSSNDVLLTSWLLLWNLFLVASCEKRTNDKLAPVCTTDWDASRYHRVSEPQFDWGQRVIARLKPVAGERILDLGCGTARLTQAIQRASAGGPAAVVGLDRSGSMLAVARASIPHG